MPLEHSKSEENTRIQWDSVRGKREQMQDEIPVVKEERVLLVERQKVLGTVLSSSEDSCFVM